MNSLLTDIAGKDEFVITPQPNAYLVTLRITPDEAKAFEGSERICLAMQIHPEGRADVLYIYDIVDGNEPGEFHVDKDDLTDAQVEIFQSLGPRVATAVHDFFNAVKPDLDEYYEMVNQHSLQRALQALLNQ